MKKEDDISKMPEDRKKMWMEYSVYLSTLHASYDVGYRLHAAYFFLTKAVTINKYGYRAFLAMHAETLARNPKLKEGVLDFLSYFGIGYGGKKERKIRSLEKLSAISELNQKKVNDFVVFMNKEKDYSPHTIYAFTSTARSFFEYANEFNQDNCRRYVKTLEEQGRAPATICLKIVALNKLSEYLKVPVVIKKPKVKRTLHTENIPTEADYNKLLDYLKGKSTLHYLFVKIMATTGARLSELLQFKWGNIIEGECVLKGKGNKYRQFYFSPELQKEVKDYMKNTQCSIDGYVFVNRFGKRISTRGLPQQLKTWGDKCGIDRSKMHPHAFRHFFAKMYLKKTKDFIQLADFLGHANIDTTRIYLQKSHEEQKRNFNRNITW